MFSIVNEFEPTNRIILYKIRNYCYSLTLDNSGVFNKDLYDIILLGLIGLILAFSLNNCFALYRIRQYIKKRGEK
jgi:hypothetical protein